MYPPGSGVHKAENGVYSSTEPMDRQTVLNFDLSDGSLTNKS